MLKIPYARQCIDNSDVEAVVKVLNSGWITQGAKVAEFEEALAEYCGAKYAVAVSSGTAALHLSCTALGLKRDDEAITSPITFLATANSVLYAGAKPVFADVDYDTVNISPDEIKKKTSKKTKVILPVHFAGLPCDMPKIYKIAEERGLKIIEDASHAFGAEYRYRGKWVKIGSCRHSDTAVFSFHPVKHITTGEGGAITTNSRKIYERLRSIRTHGVYKDKRMQKQLGGWYYEMRELGFNYRITDFQCALGLSQLERADKFIKRRREIAGIYGEAFKHNPFFDLPLEPDNLRSSWHLYVIRLKDRYVKHRKKIFNSLKSSGVGVQVHYIPVHMQPYYGRKGCSEDKLLNAENYYNRCISLPLFSALRNSEVKYVVKQANHIMQSIIKGAAL